MASYDWSVAVLVLGGVCLACVLCGGLMRPLEEVTVAARRRSSLLLTMELPDGTRVPSKGVSPNHSFKAFPLMRSVATMEKIAEDEEESFYEEYDEDTASEFERRRKILIVEDEPLQAARRERRERRMSERRLSRVLTTTYLQPVRQDSFLFSAPSVTSFHGSSSAARLARPMSRKDIFYTGSIAQISDAEAEDARRGSLVSIGRPRSRRSSGRSRRGTQDPIVVTRSFLLVDNAKNNNKEEEESTNEFLDLMKSMLNPAVLQDPKFMLIGVSNFFGFLGFYVPFVYLPSMAGQLEGISSDEAAFLLSIIGISNTLGRVLTGWISDLECVDSVFVVNVSLILSSATLFTMPFMTDMVSFGVLSSLFGLFIAAYIALTSIVLVDFCGIDNLTSAFGLLTVFRSVPGCIYLIFIRNGYQLEYDVEVLNSFFCWPRLHLYLSKYPIYLEQQGKTLVKATNEIGIGRRRYLVKTFPKLTL